MFYSTAEEQWRECLSELWGVAEERALPPEGKKLLDRVREETYALLTRRVEPLSAVEILAHLPTSSEELTALCATSRFDGAQDILRRLLRADRRFRRYDAETFGLAEWDDERHFLYYWSALERAYREGNAHEVDELAAAIERLGLPAELRRRALAVIRTHQQQLLQHRSARWDAEREEEADTARLR